MIDKKLEPYYDILLSAFLGVLLVFLLHSLYDCPRTVVMDDDDKEHFNMKHPCFDLNILPTKH